MRIAKAMAHAGLCSRREAERWIAAGRVDLDGQRLDSPAVTVTPAQRITIDGVPLPTPVPPRLWRYHKPTGLITSARDPQGRPTVFESLPPELGRLLSVGRLDMNSEGLLLLTNDGALSHALLHPSLGNEREYRVTIRGEVDARVRGALERGVVLEEGRTAPARVARARFDQDADTSTFHLTLVEGRNRQIRRSLLTLGRPVKRLVRVRFGPLRLGKLPRGQARSLRPEEIRALRAHANALNGKRKRH